MTAVTTQTSLTPHPKPAAADLPFESAATAVLGRLQVAVAALLKSASGPTGKCTDVEETFGIDPKLSWQVFRIATTPNPLAAGVNVPVRASMRRLLKAAAKRRVPNDVIDQVSDAFDEYERFMLTHAEDREELDAMIRSFLPQEREKRELANRQAAFKVMSQFKGAAMDAETCAYILYPSQDGQAVDRVLLVAELGLRRLRLGARIGFTTSTTGSNQGATRTLDGAPSEGRQSVLLPQFCTNPLPRLEVSKTENTTFYWVAGDDVGLRTSVDLVSAERRLAGLRRYRAPNGTRTTGIFLSPSTPTKRISLDLFLHKDVYQNAAPALSVYDIIPQGALRAFNDPERAHDRIQTTESIRQLGHGLINTHLSHAPRYVEMLEHVHGKLALNPDDFRGYRLDVQYPICGAQYIVSFDYPEPPADS